MWLFWLVIIALTSQTSPGPAVSVSIIDNQIWLQTASDSRQLTYDYDGIPKRLPTISPSGDALVYVVDHPVPLNSPTEEELVLLDLSGKVLRRITPEGLVPGTFERLDWLDAGRIGAMTCGHASCMYWILNPQSGKTIQVMSGGFEYIWSHNRKFVATWGVANSCDGASVEEREGGCLEHDSAVLSPDDVMYPPEIVGKHEAFDNSHSHDLAYGTFVWSPDDKWVAFTDLIGPEDDWYVVILSPDGKMLRDTVPIDPDYRAMLEWLDDTHLDLRTWKRVFHFAVQGNQFGEIRETVNRAGH
ncbi:MAG: hypothetical protein ACHP8B_09140 [Terriglobales bacterium]